MFQVILKVGGYLPNSRWTTEVELISLNGTCNQVLKPLPVAYQYPVVEFFEGNIVVCGYNNPVCYMYKRDLLWNSTTGEWEQYGVR